MLLLNQMATLRPVLRFACGTLACFYGRHATFSLLYWQLIDRNTPEWRDFVQQIQMLRVLMPNLRAMNGVVQDTLQRLARLNMELSRARQNGDARNVALLEAELEDLQQEMIGQNGHLSTLVSSVDPDQLMLMLRGFLRTSVMLSLSAASNAVRRLGIHVDIASHISELVHAALAPLLRQGIVLLAQRSPPVDSLLRYRTEHDPAAGQRWTEMGISAICSSVGLAVAFHAERLLFATSNALWGADLMLSALAHSVDTVAPARVSNRLFATVGQAPVASLARWLLVALGTYHQFIGGGRKLPAALRFALFTPMLAERTLTAATCALRTLHPMNV